MDFREILRNVYEVPLIYQYGIKQKDLLESFHISIYNDKNLRFYPSIMKEFDKLFHNYKYEIISLIDRIQYNRLVYDRSNGYVIVRDFKNKSYIKKLKLLLKELYLEYVEILKRYNLKEFDYNMNFEDILNSVKEYDIDIKNVNKNIFKIDIFYNSEDKDLCIEKLRRKISKIKR